MNLALFIATILVALLVLSVVLLVLFIVFLRTRQELDNIKGNLERKKHKASQQADEIIAEAEKESLKLLQDAARQSRKMLQTTELFSQDLKNNSAKLLTQTYNALMDKIVSYNLNLFRNISKDIQKQTEKSIDAFIKKAREDTQKAKKDIKIYKKRREQEIEKELQEYRMRKMQEIEKEARKIVAQLAKNILGETLTIADHKKIIIQSLKEAERNLKITT